MSMAEKIRDIQEEKVKKWSEEYREDVKACLEQAEKYASTHPTATTCTFWYKKTSEGFKVALEKAAVAEGMAAEFGFFGRRIKIWFDYKKFEEACFVNSMV